MLKQTDILYRAKRIHRECQTETLVLHQQSISPTVQRHIFEVYISQFGVAFADQCLINISQESLQKNNKLPLPIIFALFQKYIQARRYLLGLKLFQTHVDRKSTEKFYVILYNTAKIHKLLGNIKKSIFYLQILLKQYPFCPEAIFDLSIIYSTMFSKNFEAIHLLQRHLNDALAQQPLIHSAFIVLAYSSSLNAVDIARILSNHKLTLTNYFNLALLLKKKGDLILSEHIFQQLYFILLSYKGQRQINYHPKNQKIILLTILNLIEIKHILSRYAQAKKLFDQMTEQYSSLIDIETLDKFQNILKQQIPCQKIVYRQVFLKNKSSYLKDNKHNTFFYKNHLQQNINTKVSSTSKIQKLLNSSRKTIQADDPKNNTMRSCSNLKLHNLLKKQQQIDLFFKQLIIRGQQNYHHFQIILKNSIDAIKKQISSNQINQSFNKTANLKFDKQQESSKKKLQRANKKQQIQQIIKHIYKQYQNDKNQYNCNLSLFSNEQSINILQNTSLMNNNFYNPNESMKKMVAYKKITKYNRNSINFRIKDRLGPHSAIQSKIDKDQAKNIKKISQKQNKNLLDECSYKHNLYNAIQTQKQDQRQKYQLHKKNCKAEIIGDQKNKTDNLKLDLQKDIQQQNNQIEKKQKITSFIDIVINQKDGNQLKGKIIQRNDVKIYSIQAKKIGQPKDTKMKQKRQIQVSQSSAQSIGQPKDTQMKQKRQIQVSQSSAQSIGQPKDTQMKQKRQIQVSQSSAQSIGQPKDTQMKQKQQIQVSQSSAQSIGQHKDTQMKQKQQIQVSQSSAQSIGQPKDTQMKQKQQIQVSQSSAQSIGQPKDTQMKQKQQIQVSLTSNFFLNQPLNIIPLENNKIQINQQIPISNTIYDPLQSSFQLTGFNQLLLKEDNFKISQNSSFETFKYFFNSQKTKHPIHQLQKQFSQVGQLQRQNRMQQAYERLTMLYKRYKGEYQKQQILLSIGDLFQAQQKYSEAEKTYFKCTKFNCAQAFLRLGSLQLKLGKVESGVQNLQKANCIKRSSLQIENKLVYGYSLRQQTMSKALTLAHNILKKYPNSIETLIMTAGILQKQGLIKQAIEIVQEINKSKSTQYTMHYLGILYLQDSNLNQAFNCFKAALNIRHDYIPSLIQIASIISQTFPKQAISILRKVLQFDPSNRKALARLGKIYQSVQFDFQNAMLTYKTALQTQQNYQSYIKIGDCMAKKQSYIEALLNYKEALNLKKTHEAYAKLALMYQLKSQNSKAIQNYQYALAILSEEANLSDKRREYLISSGKLCLKIRQFDQAISAFEQALQNQESSQLLKFLGQCYFGKKQYQTALQYFQKANNISSGQDIQILQCLAICLDQMEEYLASKTIYEKIIHKEPENIRCLNNLANILLITGQTNQAFEAFQNLLQKSPKNIDKRLKVADIYAQVGDWSKVEYHLLQCYRLKEHDARILQKLIMLYKQKRDPRMVAKYEKKLSLLKSINKNKAA